MKKTSILAFAALVIACTSTEVKPPETPKPSGKAIAGFAITTEAAKVPLGNGVVETKELGLVKWVGDEGVFAVNPITGNERFIPNSSARVLRRGPLTNDAKEHNDRAVAYFKQRGLPTEQIGAVRTLTLMSSHGPRETPMEKIKPAFLGYTTVITRAVDGIGVPDSFAAIRFNEDGVPTMLWKYWPELPRKALEEALAIRAASQELKMRLPEELREAAAEVTIRHSDFDYDTEGPDARFRAFGSLDVHQERGDRVLRPRTLHFDIDGKELSLPSQRQAQSAATVDSAKREKR